MSISSQSLRQLFAFDLCNNKVATRNLAERKFSSKTSEGTLSSLPKHAYTTYFLSALPKRFIKFYVHTHVSTTIHGSLFLLNIVVALILSVLTVKDKFSTSAEFFKCKITRKSQHQFQMPTDLCEIKIS